MYPSNSFPTNVSFLFRRAFVIHCSLPLPPFRGNLSKDTAHNTGAGHQSVAFTLQNIHLAFLHCSTEPLDVFHGDTVIPRPVVHNDRSGYVDVSEANRS